MQFIDRRRVETKTLISSGTGLLRGRAAGSLEHALFSEQTLEGEDFTRRRVQGLAKRRPLLGRQAEMHLVGKHLLGGLVGVFQHEFAQGGSPYLGGMHKDCLLGRTQP